MNNETKNQGLRKVALWEIKVCSRQCSVIIKTLGYLDCFYYNQLYNTWLDNKAVAASRLHTQKMYEQILNTIKMKCADLFPAHRHDNIKAALCLSCEACVHMNTAIMWQRHESSGAYKSTNKSDDEFFIPACPALWVSGRSDGGYMWTNQTCCAKRDAVTTATQHGKVCAPSAGGRSTSGYGRSRSRTTGPWLKSKSVSSLLPVSKTSP